MKMLSWNVNGFRASVQKGFWDFFAEQQPDFLALQETKLQPELIPPMPAGYTAYWSCAEKKGYSGTAIFTRHTPIGVSYGIGCDMHDREGRVVTLEYPMCYFVTVYTPNAQDGLKRLPYRMEWDRAFRAYLTKLDLHKPVIVCGDMNVAHQEIDLKNPKSNRLNAGFSDEERDGMSQLLQSGFTDSFRYLYPDAVGAYSWWSYRFHARENNAGWRIDYFLVSDRIRDGIRQASILSDIMGSDHCPVLLDLEDICVLS